MVNSFFFQFPIFQAQLQSERVRNFPLQLKSPFGNVFASWHTYIRFGQKFYPQEFTTNQLVSSQKKNLFCNGVLTYDQKHFFLEKLDIAHKVIFSSLYVFLPMKQSFKTLSPFFCRRASSADCEYIAILFSYCFYFILVKYTLRLDVSSSETWVLHSLGHTNVIIPMKSLSFRVVGMSKLYVYFGQSPPIRIFHIFLFFRFNVHHVSHVMQLSSNVSAFVIWSEKV